MTGVSRHEGDRVVQVVIGVDTHQDQHVAVAIDRQGVHLAQRGAPATTCGYGEPGSGGPGVWDLFTPSASRAQDPMAPDSPGS